MLPTDLQPLDRFEAVQPVSKPSLSTYVYMYALYCSTRRAWSMHVCHVFKVYDTASCREACGVVAYRECLFFMYVFPRRLQSQELYRSRRLFNICSLLFVPPASIKTYVEVYYEHLRRTLPSPMCLLEREVSIFLLSRLQEEK